MKIVLLGTGCSSGVPWLRCSSRSDAACAVCQDALHPGSRNRRGNTSCLVQLHGEGGVRNILIDCGKTFREGGLKLFAEHNVEQVTSVVLTHDHADAVLGLDDIRDMQASSFIPRAPGPVVSLPPLSLLSLSPPPSGVAGSGGGSGDSAAPHSPAPPTALSASSVSTTSHEPPANLASPNGHPAQSSTATATTTNTTTATAAATNPADTTSTTTSTTTSCERKQAAGAPPCPGSTTVHCSRRTHNTLLRVFPYLFSAKADAAVKRYVSNMEVEIFAEDEVDVMSLGPSGLALPPPFLVEGLRVQPLPVWHGLDYVCFAFAFDTPSGLFVYMSDVSEVMPATMAYLEGKDIFCLALDCLRVDKVAATHMNLPTSLALVQRLRPRSTVFVGIDCSFDYNTHNAELEAMAAAAGLRVCLGYDGMVVLDDTGASR